MAELMSVKGAFVPYWALAALNLKSRGPAGATGPQGPVGPQGPAGPTGPPGSGGITVVKVADFGAVGNGVADDTVAIQNALDSAASSSSAWVQFSAGTYLISGSLYAPPGTALIGESSRAQLGQKTVLKANGAFDMVKLQSKTGTKSSSVRIQGINFNGNNLADCAIRLDQNITAHICYNAFLGFAANKVAITGGNNLYVHIDYNYFGPFDGAAIKLTQTLSSNTNAGYYGVNVGTISHNLIYSKQGTVVQGVVDIVSNDIEGVVNGDAALYVGAPEAVGYPNIANNYIELNGGTASPPVAIRFTSGSGRISGNRIYGSYLGVSGSIGIYPTAYTVLVDGNHIAGFDIGIKTDYTSSNFNPNLIGNDIASCNTHVTGVVTNSLISTSGAATSNPFSSLIQIPQGGIRYAGALAGIVVRYSYGTTIDLRRGNTFLLDFNTATTFTGVDNVVPGTTFRVGSTNGNTTLANSGFNLKKGADYTLSANEYLTFQTDHSGNVYEIGGTSASSAADLTSVLSKAPNTATRNQVTPANTTSPGLSIVTVSSQSADAINVYATDGTTKMLAIDKSGNIAITRQSFTSAIDVYNNSFTTYAFRVSSGTPASSTALGGISYDGQIQGKTGTNASPALSFLNDTNTGINGVSDVLTLVTGGKPGLTLTSTSRIGLGSDFSAATYGLHQMGGGYRLQAVSPNAPSISVGTTGSTTYYYFIVSEDVAGNYSLPSTAASVTNSAATPNNTLTFTNVKGSARFHILRHTASTISGTGNFLAGTVVPTAGAASATFTDTNASPSTFTVPTRNNTADATIDGTLSVAGGKFTVDINGYGSPRTLMWTLAQSTAATTGTNVSHEAIIDRDGKISKAYIRAKTAPSGSALIVDININGVSVWNSTQANRLQLASGSQYSTQSNFDTINVTEGDIVSVDVDAVGSGTAGQGITVQLLVITKN